MSLCFREYYVHQYSILPVLDNFQYTADYAWQTDMKTVQDANKKMLHQEIATDVAFMVGRRPNQELIRAHKYILISRSPVFCAMFQGDMKEAHSEEAIEVPDGKPVAFRELLRQVHDEVAGEVNSKI